MRVKFLGIFAAVVLLAACETAPEQSASSSGSGQATTSSASTAAPAAAAPVAAVRPGSQEDLVVNVGDRVFFDFDRFDLKAAARETLEKQAAWLKANGGTAITIEGHADERGTREYNLALGERRANSAKDHLIALGVAPARIRIVSFGKERPVALGSNEAAWAQNRRSVTVVGGAGS